MSSGFNFDEEVLLQALRNIYQKQGKEPTYIEENLFREFCRGLDMAVTEGYAPVNPDEEFFQALLHSNEVFAAFKTHRAQCDMAAQLLDSNGNLKPFEQWKNDVQSIASHQCRSWLETEYNTAVLRAHQAADWQQFLQEADVLPNLKWMPSTSPNPGADHMPFWGTILPINDPFWDQHRPGDRWNCKCSLTSTDEPTTPVPSVAVSQQPKNTPQRGLENNPGKDAAVFSDKHPYFPKSCNVCPFYKSEFKAKLKQLFTNRAKDCYNCPYINTCINDIGKAERIKAHKEEYHRLLNDPDYKDVEFDKINGGVKATHVDHKEHKNDKKTYFPEQLTGDQLENIFQDKAYRLGHSVIFRAEADNTVDLDMILDGIKMDLISVTENSETFRGQLKRKNNQLRNYNHLYDETNTSVCMYFHDPSYYSYNKVERGLKQLQEYGVNVKIKNVYVLLNDSSDIFRLDFP